MTWTIDCLSLLKCFFLLFTNDEMFTIHFTCPLWFLITWLPCFSDCPLLAAQSLSSSVYFGRSFNEEGTGTATLRLMIQNQTYSQPYNNAKSGKLVFDPDFLLWAHCKILRRMPQKHILVFRDASKIHLFTALSKSNFQEPC